MTAPIFDMIDFECPDIQVMQMVTIPGNHSYMMLEAYFVCVDLHILEILSWIPHF